MRVFKSNTTRIVIACFIIFMAIPFIFVESSGSGKRSDVSIPMESSANPLSKIIDRIGSFYGFKKARPARGSFEKGSGGVSNGEVLASLKNPIGSGSAEGSGSGVSSSGSGVSYSDASYSDSGAVHGVPAGRLPQVKEYVRMDGETYEVVSDPSGRKFVAMPDGFVPYEKLMSDTVSQEDFEAARAQAPELEDWEIFEALRSPGGLPAYLASGGKNVFYKDDSPGYYSEGAGPGGEGRRLFGISSAGSGAALNDDDIYDERKFTQGIMESKAKLAAKNDAIGGNMRVKYVKGQKTSAEDKAQNQQGEGFSSLIKSKVVIGNEKVGFKESTPSGQNTFVGRNQKQVKTIKLKREDVGSYMARTMGVEDFYKIDANGEELLNPWVYPEDADIKEWKIPGTAFFESNESVFNNKEGIRAAFEESDKVYTESQEKIADLEKEGKINFKLAVIDGVDDNGRIRALSKDTFHYKIVANLIKGENNFGPYINIKPSDKAGTVFVVPDSESFYNLKSAGYNAVLFNNYAITPSDLTNFYQDARKELSDMYAKKRNGAADEEEIRAKTKEVLASKVRLTGI